MSQDKERSDTEYTADVIVQRMHFSLWTLGGDTALKSLHTEYRIDQQSPAVSPSEPASTHWGRGQRVDGHAREFGPWGERGRRRGRDR